MSLDLYGDENRVVEYLRRAGLSDASARIYTVVLCRQYRAPKNELASALRFHLPGLEHPASSESRILGEINELIARGLLREVAGLNEVSVEARSPWAEALSANLLQHAPVDPQIASIIDESLKAFADFSPHERALIERLGWATWDQPRQRWQEAIRQAKDRIRIGVYSSITVYDEIKDAIRDAMVNRGSMTVQILMFSPELAARIEKNPDLANDVRQRTADWLNLFEDTKLAARERGHRPKLEIRHIEDATLSAFHRVMLIDRRQWILNIHRPGVERGIEGIVYQGDAENENPSNIHGLLEQYWDAAWARGRSVRWPGRLWHDIQHLRPLVAFVLMPVAWQAAHADVDWLGVEAGWWGGAAICIIASEIYNNFAAIVKGTLKAFESAAQVLERLTSQHQ